MTINVKEPDSSSDLAFEQFPSLPQDPYIADSKERVKLSVSLPRLLAIDLTVCHDYLHLAWAVVLATHTGSDEVLFGSAQHGRCTETGAQAMTPVRLHISKNATVSETLAAVASYRRHIAKWEHLDLQQYSTMGLEPITTFQFRNLFVIAGPAPPQSTPSYARKYPLAVFAGIESSTVHLHAVMDPRLLVPDVAHMMLFQFADVLNTALEDTKTHVRDLQGVGPLQWNKLLEWNSHSITPGTSVSSIGDLIEASLRTHAKATAVCAWDGTLTYEELDLWASAVAMRLINAGVTAGSFVGVYLDKSVAAVVAMVAIIKAGGALVFLPPSMPSSRLSMMCERLRVRVILTTAETQTAAAALGVPTLLLQPGADASRPFYLPVEHHHPLYAVFTSGSTGEPKAVVVQRGAYGLGVESYCKATGITADCRMFQAVSYMFVLSIIEQLNALSVGACICVPSPTQLQNDMGAAMCQLEVNWCILTPSWARILDPSQLPQLKRMLLTGEPYDHSDVQRWTSHTQLYAVYGQAEAATTILVKPLQGPAANEGGLGHASFGNCWVVDPEDYTRLRPLGVEGELLIDSPALASGYLRSPDQTAATYVDPPTWLRTIRPNGANYPCLRSGDLVRYQDLTGSLRLLGRKGTETKIRGQRVALGEVETALRVHFPTAQHLIVGVIHPSGREEAQALLVALIQDPSLLEAERQAEGKAQVLGTSSSTYREQTRRAIEALHQLLPSYMVPSAIIPIHDVPTTTTGKIARKALLEHVAQLSVREILSYNGEDVPYRAPSTPQEQLLQEACEELLSLSTNSVGMDDNFFNIGGDSVSARQLVHQARCRGLHFTVQDVFDKTTFAELARSSHLGNVEQVGRDLSVLRDDPFAAIRAAFLADLPPSITKEQIEDVLPTKEFQRSILEHRSIGYVPIVLNGDVDRLRLRHACARVLRELAVLRSVFIPFHGQSLQVILREVDLPWDEVVVPEGEEMHGWLQAILAERLKQKPPIHQPSVNFMLVQCSQSRQEVLVLRMSQAICDRDSLIALTEHLSAGYNGETLAVQSSFADYMRAWATLFTPGTFAVWRHVLKGAQVTRPPCSSSPGQDVPVISSAICTPSSPPTKITMATAVKAAWSYVLRRYSGHGDVLFGQVSSCRGVDLPGASDIVGLCSNVSPVRVQYETLLTVHDLLRAIQSQHTSMLKYQSAEWEEIVRYSTSWPEDTELDSVVFHEDFGNAPSLRLGKATGELGKPIFTTPAWKKITLITRPEAGRRKMAVCLMSRKGFLEEQLAQSLVNAFTATLERMLDSPNDPIASLESVF